GIHGLPNHGELAAGPDPDLSVALLFPNALAGHAAAVEDGQGPGVFCGALPRPDHLAAGRRARASLQPDPATPIRRRDGHGADGVPAASAAEPGLRLAEGLGLFDLGRGFSDG